MLQWSLNGGESRTPRGCGRGAVWRGVKGCIYNARAPLNRRVVITHVDLPIKRSTRDPSHIPPHLPRGGADWIPRALQYNVRGGEDTHHTYFRIVCPAADQTRGTRCRCIYIDSGRRAVRTSGSIVRHNNNQLFTIHRVRARTPNPPLPLLAAVFLYTYTHAASEARPLYTRPDPTRRSFPSRLYPIQRSPVPCVPPPTRPAIARARETNCK